MADSGIAARAHRRRRRSGEAIGADHRVLGDGPHAAEEQRGDDSGNRQSAAAARRDRQARRRRLPRARPLERSGRSDDGHLGTSAARLLDALQRNFDFDPPRHHGFDTVQTIQAMHDGRVQVFVQLGGNFLSAAPDTRFVQESLAKLRLSVRIGTKLNRSDLVTGRQALILPCLGRSEIDRQRSGDQFVTTENSMGVVEMSRGRFAPASGDLRSEVAIVCGIAQATLPAPTTVGWAAWCGRLRRNPRGDQPDDPGLRRLQREGAAAGRIPPAERRAWQRVRHRLGPRTLHGESAARAERGAGAARDDDGARARPVQHDRVRPRRSVPRRLQRAARDLHERRGHRRSAGSCRERSSTSRVTTMVAPVTRRASSSCRTTSRRVAARRTTRKAMCSFPSTACRRRATSRRANMCSISVAATAAPVSPDAT